MASRGQYLLRIGGRLNGKFENKDVLSELGSVFKEPGVGVGVPEEYDTGGWPNGFILKGYTTCQWSLIVDYPYPTETMISFRAEVHHTFPNTLFDNRIEMLKHVHWFYHYRKYLWWRELNEKLVQLNKSLASRFKQTCIPERIWYRDWQWYCGNGGC